MTASSCKVHNFDRQLSAIFLCDITCPGGWVGSITKTCNALAWRGGLGGDGNGIEHARPPHADHPAARAVRASAHAAADGCTGGVPRPIPAIFRESRGPSRAGESLSRILNGLGSHRKVVFVAISAAMSRSTDPGRIDSALLHILLPTACWFVCLGVPICTAVEPAGGVPEAPAAADARPEVRCHRRPATLTADDL